MDYNQKIEWSLWTEKQCVRTGAADSILRIRHLRLVKILCVSAFFACFYKRCILRDIVKRNNTYDHFAEGESPEPPFICYLIPGSDNFAADGRVYFKLNEVRIEMYTDFKDVALESRLEDVLDRHEIFYNKSETWIQSGKLYEVMYSFDMEDLNNG